MTPTRINPFARLAVIVAMPDSNLAHRLLGRTQRGWPDALTYHLSEAARKRAGGKS